MKMSLRIKTLTRSLITISTFLIVVSACGGRGVKLEINSAEDSGRQLREMAETQRVDPLPARDIPEMNSDDYEAHGDALLRKGKASLAYVQYEKCLKAKPDNVRVEYKKGLCLLIAEKNDDAISQFKLVMKKDPKFDLAYEGLGRAYFQQKDYPEAEANLRKAVELNHKLWASYNYLGNIYDYKKDYEKAILEYTSAISVMPEQGFLYNNLGFSFLLAGHNQAAVDAFGKAVEKKYRENRVFNNMALAYANLGRYDEAMEAFRKAGGEAHAYNNMGCIYLEKGNYPEAVRCFEKAIAIEPAFYAKANDNLKKAKTLAAKQ